MKRFHHALTCALLILSTQAHAQTAPGNATAEADALFQKGNALYEKKEWAGAEAAYEKALVLKTTHDIASNLGYSEMRQGKYVEAAEHLALAARIWPPTVKDDDRRKGLLERLATVKKEVVTLTIEVSQPGAHVTVNGSPVGTSPLPADVFAAPGTVRITATLAGYSDAAQELVAEKGTEKKVALAMETVAPLPTATTAPSPSVTTSLPPPPKPSLPIVIAGAGATLVLTGIGVGLMVAAGDRGSSADEKLAEIRAHAGPCTKPPVTADCEALLRLRQDHDAFFNAGIGLFVGSGLVALGTAAYGLWPRKPTVAVAPLAGKDIAGLTVQGSF